ncbi:hypothetical protein SAMN04489724_3043 [Algoriphagus locisalis]|uniref:Uncharacterized protein n=1 Tax=Algoriphagus locisalis TaxID=305507 RepID=A0A1I7CBN4_9BACT|nr:hypothetical protein SAMN04489724_3043 [Algoriphagus locisalis]
MLIILGGMIAKSMFDQVHFLNVTTPYLDTATFVLLTEDVINCCA